MREVFYNKKNWIIIGLSFLLMLIGLAAQKGIMGSLDSGYKAEKLYMNSILFDVMGILIMILVAGMYTYIEKINVKISVIIIIIYCVLAGGLLLLQENNYGRLRLLRYYYSFFFPLIMGVFAKENIYEKVRRPIRSVLTAIAVIIFFAVIGFNKNEIFSMITLTSFVIIYVMGIAKPEYTNKRTRIAAEGVIAAVSFIAIFGKSIINPYEIQKILLLNIKNSKFIGMNSVLDNQRDTLSYTDYIFNQLVSDYGILPGILVLAIVGILIITIYKKAITDEKDVAVKTICLLLGTQTILCVLSNIGIIYAGSVSIPFIGYGLVGTISYSVLIGIALGKK